MATSLEEILEKIRQHPRLVITDDYEIAIQRTKSHATEYAGGKLSGEEKRDLLWISLRVIHRKQPGRAAISAASADSLPQLVESAFEAAKHSAPDPWFRFPIWKSPKKSEVSLEDSPDTTLFEEVEGLLPNLRERYATAEVETRLARKTERLQLADKRKLHGSRLGILLDERGIELTDERAHSHPLAGRKAWAKALQRRALEQTDSHDLSASPRSLLLTPTAATKLVAAIAPWFYGDRIQSGQSPLGAPGPKRIFSPLLTLVDDGELAGGVHCTPFDHEGVVSQETILVDKGEHRGLLLDTYCATRENRLGTGNFLRHAGQLFPSVTASNLFFRAGNDELSDLVGRIGEGVVVEHWDTPIPATDGAVHFIGRGWEVVGGRPTRPVQGKLISCRIIDLLSHVAGIGKDVTFFGAYGSPSILCEDLPLNP